MTAFVAAGVVSVFQDTLDRIVVLAVFLPVLAGQSGNTGCQALAVTLRGLALGEIDRLQAKSIIKEAWVGILNGVFVGLVAGIGMTNIFPKPVIRALLIASPQCRLPGALRPRLLGAGPMGVTILRSAVTAPAVEPLLA